MAFKEYSYLTFIFILTFFSIVKADDTNEPKTYYTITEGYNLIETLSMDFYVKHIPKTKLFKYQFSSKIIYLETFEKLQEYFDKYDKLFNNNWVIMFDNQEVFNKIDNKLVTTKYDNILAFIWLDTLKDYDFYKYEYPVFLANETIFNTIKTFSIDNYSGNYFLNIYCIYTLLNFR